MCLENVVLPDRIYEVQGWTRLMYATLPEELSALELWIKWQSNESAPKKKRLLARRDNYLKSSYTFTFVKLSLRIIPNIQTFSLLFYQF